TRWLARGARHSRTAVAPELQAPAARVVRPPRTYAAMARDLRSVPHPRVGNHAPADAGRSRAAEIPRMAGEVSDARGARGRARARRDGDMAAARIQHQAETPAGDCA